jgi:resuscitation-promoting factor RpfA
MLSKHARHAPHARKSRAHVYVVRSGDTLTAIARTHHVHGGWPALFRANRSRLSNPNMLRIGQHLRLH